MGSDSASSLVGEMLAYHLHWSWLAQMDSESDRLYRKAGGVGEYDFKNSK